MWFVYRRDIAKELKINHSTIWTDHKAKWTWTIKKEIIFLLTQYYICTKIVSSIFKLLFNLLHSTILNKKWLKKSFFYLLDILSLKNISFKYWTKITHTYTYIGTIRIYINILRPWRDCKINKILNQKYTYLNTIISILKEEKISFERIKRQKLLFKY